ncbi:metallophosphoesterase [Clostridium botulinum]|uniref:metallophosphoesterase n=1 Tax=Clostridium botulinum TaxID=1491 RepID=UPI00077448E3|nr:metallophosphoesterase [Clostridium botulinum]
MSITRIIFALTIFFSIYGGANYYIARRLYQWLNVFCQHINVKIYTGIYIFIAVSMIFAFLPIPREAKDIISWISSYWMGIFIYLLIFLLAMDFVILLGSIAKIIPSPIPQSLCFYKGLIPILLTMGFVGYGIYNANQVEHVSYDIQLKENTLSSNMKIVLISDLHLGAVNSEKNLKRVVQGINDMKPDIVCIVGDIFNDDFNAIRNPSEAINLFRSINATYGVYACLGNHDGGRTLDKMINFLQESNIKLLNDEYVIIEKRLALFGRLDSSHIGGSGELKRQDITDAIASVGANMPVIVMDHNPSHIEEYGKEVDLILAGHTHRGQLFPANLITDAIFVVDYGYYQKDADSPHVILTSGSGTWGMPMRVGFNNEIVSIILR